MKIVYVCADRGIPVLGAKGASVHVRSITAALQRVGHEVVLVAGRFDGDNPAPDVARIVSLAGEPTAAQHQLKELLTSEHAQLVIERYSLESGPARAAARDCGIPHVLEVNAPLVSEATRYRGLDDPDAQEREIATLRDADAIHVVSPGLQRWVERVAPGVRTRWIPNGVDTALFESATPAALAGVTGPVIGFVGSMKAWHGVDLLVEAFARARAAARGAHLVLVGAGPREHDLREQCVRLGLVGSVTFTGHVNHDAVPAYVKRFDIAVAPYLPQPDFYFHPLKVVEYLAAGVPVVFSDQGELPALVGPAGLSFTPGSATDLADVLGALIADPSRVQHLAQHTAGRVRDHDWDSIARRVAALGAEVVR